MKKASFIFLLLILLICMGCSKNIKPIFNNKPYPSETAIKNGDVVRTNNGISHNIERLEKFTENVKKKSKDKIRITQYTDEGGAILTDLDYDGKQINYTYDTTRDGFGARTIEKKKFNNIYQDGDKYHVKNSSEDIIVY